MKIRPYVDAAYDYCGFNSVATSFGTYLDSTTARADKINVLMNHFIRTATMTPFMAYLPFHPVVNCGIGLVLGHFYHAAIEKRACPFYFSIPAAVGASAILCAQPAVVMILNGIALQSFATFGIVVLRLAPVITWTVIMTMLSCEDVDARRERLGIVPTKEASNPRESVVMLSDIPPFKRQGGSCCHKDATAPT